jgi:monovalent cation:H+ antiporter, CPA1 family
VSQAAGPDVGVFLGLLIAVAVVAAFVRFVRVPYTVALVLAGLGLAFIPNVPGIALTPGIILTVFLPVLLFHGAYNLDVAELRANLTAVALLAVPGVVVTAGLVGAVLHLAGGLPWPVAVLFGTIVAATDPVAVLAVFGELGAPRRLTTIVTAESLFNDGTALVFFATALTIATAHGVDVATTAEQFVVAVLGALALGAVVALIGARVLRRIDDALLETTVTLIMAYGGYLLAQQLGSSGPLETVAAGLFLGAQGERVMSPTTRLQARATWDFLDFLANSLLFLLVGLALRSISTLPVTHLGVTLWRLLLVAIVAVLAARGLAVGGVQIVLALRRRALPRGWPLVLSWSGLRGGVSLAAALSVPLALPQRDLLLTLTFGVVLFTLLGEGLTISPLLDRLGIAGIAGAGRRLERVQGRLLLAEAAIAELDALRRAGAAVGEPTDRLAEAYARRRRDLRAELGALYRANPLLAHAQERQAQRQLLVVQREAAHDAYTRGRVSAGTLRELVAEIDRELVDLEVEADGKP